MPNGYVYILVNPALKGQVKIGKTTNSPEQRAGELSSTGIPHDFIVAYAERVCDCDKVERLLHDRFKDVRVNPNREFFHVTPQAAIRAVIEIAKPFVVDDLMNESAGSHGRDTDPYGYGSSDAETQARLREEKRLRRILLMRDRNATANQ